jgi:hypothetical protein
MIRSRSRGDLREDSQSSSLTEQQQVLCMGLMLILIHSPRCSFRKPQANLGLLAYHGASVPQHGGVRSRPNPRAELCGLSQWWPEKSFAPSSATLSLSPLVSCLDRTFSVFPMLQNDTAVFHAFAWDLPRPNTMTGEVWEREQQLPNAALKLKGLCITVRKNGLRTDGSISQKAAKLRDR